MDTKKPLPLAGMKVVELATVVAAPVVGRLLANYGAEVIKIETPPFGDQQRRIANVYQMTTADGDNPGFDVFNSGKKKIALNLKTKAGMEVMEKLLEDADVFLSNVRMGSLTKMALDYESVHEKHPRLIYAHLSGYGLKGPDAQRPGFDYSTFWLKTGALSDFVPGGVTHLAPTYGFGDIVTAANLLSGILMAIIGREKTGKGSMVTISLYGTGIWTNAFNVLCTQPQFGMAYPPSESTVDPFSGWHVCADGKSVYCMTKEYRRDKLKFAEIYNMPELLTDPRFEDMDTIRESGVAAEYGEKVDRFMAARTSDEMIAIFEKYDIPYGPETHFADICKDEQAWANDCLENVTYPSGVVAMPKPPVKFSEYDQREFKVCGAVGEETHEVLNSLGYSDEDIDEMSKSGVL